MFVGDNPPDGAVINYYQRERHLFGRLKLEVLDASGRVIDDTAALIIVWRRWRIWR